MIVGLVITKKLKNNNNNNQFIYFFKKKDGMSGTTKHARHISDVIEKFPYY